MRFEYEAREKAIRDHSQMMFEAEQRGIKTGMEIGEKNGRTAGAKEKSFQIAENMCRKGMDIDMIVELTGLSREDIQAQNII